MTAAPPAGRRPPPGLIRRLAALAYDSLLLGGLWFAATALLLPFRHGRAFQSHDFFYTVYLILISFLFLGWFWTHGGQTLGLRVWHLKVCALDGGAIGWKQAAMRFIAAAVSLALFGLGFIWILFDRDKCSWHDRFSNTRIIRLD